MKNQVANYPFISICFVLVLHNLVLVVFSADEGSGYQPICPNSFRCQSLGNLSFPFYTSNNSACGLCRLNCNEAVPEIFLGEDGPSYELLQVMPGGANLRLRDRSFLNDIDNQSCSAFTERSRRNSPSISFTISPNFTFLRCPKSPGLGDQIDEYFQEAGEYYQYNTCNDYNYYYTSSRGYISASVNPMPQCSVIVLPAVSPSMLPGNTNFTNPFVLLRPEFDLVLLVSSSCQECYSSGGQCLNDNQEFRCLYSSRNTTKDNPRDLVIKSALATIGVGTVIILVILVFCLRFKIISWFKTDASIKMETFIKNHEALAPKRYSYSQVKKMTDSFKVKLGQGGYGSVYRGTLFNGSPVAVKVLDELKGNGEDLINELASISKTSHVNIVGLLGFCFESHHRALIYEYMPNGSLEKFISNRSSVINGQLEWEKLYEIAVGIARGLEYLHIGCNTRIVHLDIKPHNILLDQDFCPKISDFGLAKLCPEKRSVISLSGMRGTPGYIAPEVFSRHFGEVSHKSDVYSYGMMVLEMVGGIKNLVDGIDHTSDLHFPQWIYKQLASNETFGLSGIVNEKENEKVKKMIFVSLWCIQSDPSSRPSMTKVLEMLEGSLEFLLIPPKPFLFSPPISPCSNI